MYDWIDITATISDGMTRWPDDPPVQVRRVAAINDNSEANVTAISTTAHVGTHIDAPLHFIPHGIDVASVPLEQLVGTAKVFHITNSKEISLADIQHFDIANGDRILFRTRNSEVEWEQLPFMKDYVYLSTDAARFLAEKKIKCIGIDYLSLGNKDNDPQVHKLILGTSIIIIEGLKLKDIAPGIYDMVCLPLKIEGSDGAPCRVIIRKQAGS